jgi:hypothetical protein
MSFVSSTKISKFVFGAAVLAVTGIMAAPLAALAAPHEIKLATPEVALQACKSGKIGQWDIAYAIGKDSFTQQGPGYNCAQGAPPNGSGVGNAIDASGNECVLATPEEAKAICSSLGEWDIAYVVGKGTTQQGPGYKCAQGPSPNGSGVGNAICK